MTTDLTKETPSSDRLDPSWYRDEDNPQVVWESKNSNLKVIAVGEMHYIYSELRSDGRVIEHSIHETDDLEKLGIKNDQQLKELMNDEDYFYTDDTPWFEIINGSNPREEYPEIYGNLDEAIEALLCLEEEQREERF